MKIRIELVARGTVEMEITKDQKEKLLDEDVAEMDLTEFENSTGIDVDTSEAFETSSMTVSDVELLSDDKSEEGE